MLDKLSPQQVELALEYLVEPPPLTPPPQELEHLQEMEWFLLSRMLDSLMQEKEHHPLQ